MTVLECTPQVRAASHIKTNEPVAIKIINRTRMSEEKGAEDKGQQQSAVMALRADGCRQ